jgi:hypothetical protein
MMRAFEYLRKVGSLSKANICCELFMARDAIPKDAYRTTVDYTVGGADFLICWIFNRQQLAADVKCYSKTKVDKAFFFISCLPLQK